MSPEKNQDPYRDDFKYQPLTHRHFEDTLHKNQITPNSSPKYIDLFSGNAPVARLFHQLGWRDITAIDIYEPDPEPNFPIKWLYGDLVKFSWDLRQNKAQLSPFFPYFHQFDILTCISPINANSFVIANDLTVHYLADFFLKSDGVFINNVYQHYTLLPRPTFSIL